MTLFLFDISRHQAERSNPPDLAAALRAGFGIVNIQLDRGRQEDVLPDWALTYANRARALGMGICTYRWLDSRLGGAASANRAYSRMLVLGGATGTAGLAHIVDTEEDAAEAEIRAYLTTMQGLLGRPIGLYTGDWWWTAPSRRWQMADLTPYLHAAPNAGYLGDYPGDASPHWAAGYGGWQNLSLMQYAVEPLPGQSGDCSLTAIRDPAVWTALTAGAPVSPRPNPNPTRISGPLWTLIQRCTDLTPTSFVNEYSGSWTRKPGSHADLDWLLVNYPNDYSLKGAKQTTGPRQYGRAWDWTFPSAQAGNWTDIGLYSLRVKAAYDSNDPRMYGVFEILCQTPEDREPEGYVFYPSKRFRVPDATHEWHLHIGILTQYINDAAALDALYSVLAGESLASWSARTGTPGSPKDDDMLTIFYDGTGYGIGNGVHRKVIMTWPEMLAIQAAAKAGHLVAFGAGTIVTTADARVYGALVDEGPWLTESTAASLAAATVELSARLAELDNGLPGDPAVIGAAVREALAADMANLDASLNQLAAELAAANNGLPADLDEIRAALKQALREGVGA